MTVIESAGRPARVRRALLIANAALALVVSAGLFVLLGHSVSGTPVGSLVVPGHGGWTVQYLLTHGSTHWLRP